MMIGENVEVGFPPRGNVMLSPGPGNDQEELFGVVIRSLPWEGSAQVFGLGDSDCSCPTINLKNGSMVLAGTLISVFGLGTRNAVWNMIARVAGGFIAGYGLADIVGGFYKKSSPAPVPTATPVPTDSRDLMGLGSEWYADTQVNEYLNKYVNSLQSKCQGCVSTYPE